MKPTLLCKFAAMATILLAAVSAMAATITGTVTDRNGDPVDATVRLLSAADSSYITGVKADLGGPYTITHVKPGRYVIEATYIGLAAAEQSVTVDSADVDVKPITLSDKSQMLDEVSVVAVKTQIKVMEDTVEFNADSYQSQPNAVVEDLLKRLPGVEVGSDGKITANGREVTKILVDGKEFFGDDPTVASKNLPVNMVDKLQVVDRKSDLARLTGVDDGEDETVINLTVKKGHNNGWFGNAEAGYGTDSRYMGTFNVNRFWNGNQLTLLGNFNNINEPGFADGNAGRFRRFGGDNGLNATKAIGLNFNVGREEILRVGGNVFYSYSDRDNIENRERQYLFTDSTSYAMTGRHSRDKGHSVRGDFRVLWNPDSFNTLEVRPRFSFNDNRSASADSTLTLSGLREPVNRSVNLASSDGRSTEFGITSIYSHRFRRHRGRSFSIMGRYNYSNVREKDLTESLNEFFLLDDSDEAYNQWADSHTWSHTAAGRVTWTEPLGNVAKGNFLTFAYRMSYRWNDADKLVYDLPDPVADLLSNPRTYAADPLLDYAREELNEQLSDRFRNNYFNQDIRIGYQHVSKTHNLDAGLSIVPQTSESRDLMDNARSIPARHVWNFAPFLRYRYKSGKNRSFNIFYHGRASQPSMSQLQPVPDMSDPLRIVVGNPELDPSFTHNIRLRFQDYNPALQRSIMLMGFISATQNSIVSTTTFNPETGGQLTEYRNVNGVWNGRLMNMISMPLRDKRWLFSNHLFLSYDHSIGFNDNQRNTSGSLRVGESFSIAFRPKDLDLELRPYYNIQHTANTLRSTGNMTVHTYGGTFTGSYVSPWGITIGTDLTYTGTSGYSEGFDNNQWMWNATLSYSCLRDRSLTFALKAYDLLQQKSNVSRNVTANYIDDATYNTLTRYFMVSVAYRFNTFGKGNEPQSRNDMWGPGPGRGHGPGGPGRRPPHP